MRIGQVAHAHIRADRHHRLAIFQPSVRAAHRQTNKVVIIAHAPAQRAHRSRRSGERQARSHWKRRAGDARLIGIAAERDAAAGHAQETALLRRPPCFQIPAQPDVLRRHPAREIRGLNAAEAPVRALPEQRHRLVRQHRGELKRVVVPVPRPRGAQGIRRFRTQTRAPHADTPAHITTAQPRQVPEPCRLARNAQKRFIVPRDLLCGHQGRILFPHKKPPRPAFSLLYAPQRGSFPIFIESL